MFVQSGGKLYFVDTDSIRIKMLEPMPLIMPEPPPISLSRIMTLPKIMDNRATIIMHDYDCGSGWTFAYLFPLGKKAYIRKR